jgi:hypothetical protein
MDRSSLASWGTGVPRLSPIVAVVAATLGCLALLLSPALARAEGPGVGTPSAVSVGDSYISGEAGRWAGNTYALGYQAIDALRQTAYYDNAAKDGELIPFCHRSKSAEIHIGGVNGENLACSGAKTSTFTEEGHFKPGLDFYYNAGNEGQALMLRNFAHKHNVKLVAVSIGGNNYNFASIVETCIKDYLTSTESKPIYCKEDASVRANFSNENVIKQTTAIQGAIMNVAKAMNGAGYSTAQYTIVVQDYPSPIPDGAGFRYPQKEKFERGFLGGCGFWNEDADWANSFVLPTIDKSVFAAAAKTGLPNIERLELLAAFDGRRLCEARKDFGLLEEVGLSSWGEPGAVDKTEWINQARIVNDKPYELQEDLHPNYWGQLALRSCLTLIYNAGSPRSGACTIAGEGFNSEDDPNMMLSPVQPLTIAQPRKKHHKHRRHRHPSRRRSRQAKEREAD